jgi:NitT/TauT family transport system permease protein
MTSHLNTNERATRASTTKPSRSWKESRLASPAVLIVFLILWEAMVRLLDVPKILLPPPSAVAVALWSDVTSGFLLPHVLVTLWEIASGFVIGAGIGVLLGVAIGQSAFLERVFYPYVVAFQTVPKVAIAPIIVIWFGYDVTSKVIITATISFFPVLANTIVGLRSTPREQIEMLRACTATEWQIFRMARLPQALPFIFVGLDVAIIVSVIGAIVGEFVGAKAGLGYVILQKNFTFDIAGVFAILIVLSLIGILLHWVVISVQRRLLFWAESSQTHREPV